MNTASVSPAPESPKGITSPGSAWSLPVTAVRGVGPERATMLDRLEIRTVGDLLMHRPRRYEDRRRLVEIRTLGLGDAATVAGRIVACGVKWFRQRTRSMFEFVLDDGTGRLHCRWWNVPQLERVYAVGQTVLVFGKVKAIRPISMDHPETERYEGDDDPRVHLDRWVPIHGLTDGLSARVMRTLVWNALERFAAEIPVPIPDLVPAQDSRQVAWPERVQAVRDLHFPGELTEAERARERFALEEFLGLQLEIQRRRLNLERNAVAMACAGDNRWIRPFLAGLGFRLTTAQTRVLREIRADLGGKVPMRRLLQGDVGSGKTVVAACAALMTLESGHEVALMAPTEILARQLAANLGGWFGPLGIVVELRAGGRVETVTGPDASADAPRLVVGTHALVQDGVEFRRLGLVIIDEQHKFGVVQRETLLRKGRHPHLLVMTATPIPRTLGLTLYGDLDVSVLDQSPGGRQPIRTHVREVEALPRVWAFVRGELDAGRQAYVVCPRVDESEQDDVRAVTREQGEIARALAPARVGLVHGRMASEERDAAMKGFREGKVQVLVATPVIEVGVDVPNASVMVILSAQQFGLAQLHQLRGRVGRGPAASHCILVADAGLESAGERLRVVESTSDGFRLAEADFRMRGPGEFLGRNQSGMPLLRFGDLVADEDLVRQARELARAHLRGAGEGDGGEGR